MTSEARAALPRGLYAITPQMSDTAALVRSVEECLAGGAALIQYRSKQAPPALALEQARRLALACRAAHVPLIVNDSVELALAAGADGVHLGREDGLARGARDAFPRGIIGVSCYDEPLRARAASEAGADYVAVGSLFASGTKPGAKRASLETIAAAKRISGLPVAAIGGITLDNAARVVAAGADLLAVIAAVFDAPDVRAAAQSFANLYVDEPRNARAQSRAV
jgi:thiamine-phosphate pyrophosphorylase